MQSNQGQGWIGAVFGNAAVRRVGGGAALISAFAWLLLADYPPALLTGLIALYFLGYVALRLLIWLEGSRFSPDYLRVGFCWALLGIDPVTDRYDRRPVVIYFLLLAVLAAGLLLRPLAQWILA